MARDDKRHLTRFYRLYLGMGFSGRNGGWRKIRSVRNPVIRCPIGANNDALRTSTHWVIDAPLQAVWEVAYDIEHWPSWWRYVDAVIRLEPGERTGVGAVYRCVWTTRLLYTLTFDIRATRVQPYCLIEGAVSGEIEGIGRCIFRNLDFGTSIHHEWRVRTTKPWMNRLAAPLKPVFTWNHHAVMKAGGDSLAERLGATLLRFETRQPSLDFRSQAGTRSGGR